MNFTGKLEGLKMDYATKKQSISVEVNEDARDAFQELKDCEKLDIQIKKHREKRSLDANAYYWVLITKFAKKLELSNPEAHNMCLIRYGYIYELRTTLYDGEYAVIDSSTRYAKDRKIVKVKADGTEENLFNSKNNESSIWEKIPAGLSIVSWNGAFGFDIILFNERGTPRWTLH